MTHTRPPTSHHKRQVTGLIATAALLAATLLTGCGGAVYPSAAKPVAIAATSVQGIVMGGQQPVAGVMVQLYQAGTTGYGSAATPLGPAVYTTANGNFDLPTYSCAAGSQVYLVGTGGQPIAATMTSPAITNSNLAMMVGLGTCGGTGLSSFINVNELTTVATVWALSPFMTGIANVGSSPGNAAGLANAFAAINELVTTANGTLPGPTLPAGATLPSTEINTLADILEQCINSGGGAAGDSSNCGNLFQLAPNAAGTVFPADTITAALNIAQSPGRNVASLNKLRSSSPVFQPALDVNSPPAAWTIAITYVGGGLSAPSSLAVDGAGAVWVSNHGNASVTKLDNTGAAVSGPSGFTAGGFNAPSAIAIDAGGNAWVTNAGNNTVTKLNPAGSAGTVYSGIGLSTPRSIAIDGSGTAWVANAGANTVTAITGSGAASYSGGGSNAPVSVAVTPK
jgi:streptogramin lyase